MYQPDSNFQLPEDCSKIWRFMNFDKFHDLLETSALFFCRADKLGEKFEGILPDANLKKRRENYEKNSTGDGWTVIKRKRKDITPQLLDHDESLRNEDYRKAVCISCWHINDDEDNLMWRSYLGDEDGVAITSSVKRLKESFKGANKDIRIGKVHYINYQTQEISQNPENNLSVFMHKNKEFKEENELRIIYGPSEKWDAEEVQEGGKHILVDLNTLVDEVFLKPGSGEDFFQCVSKVANEHKLNSKIKKSALDSRTPQF